MKTIFTLVMGLSFAIAAQAGPATDSTNLQIKVQQLEKQVQELKTEVKNLRSDCQAAGVKSSTPKKLVIDRRGSKQAIYQ
jgi:outer membrane murein-binding lipoprotein Lpp